MTRTNREVYNVIWYVGWSGRAWSRTCSRCSTACTRTVYAILYYTMLCYTVLYYTILYHTILLLLYYRGTKTSRVLRDLMPNISIWTSHYPLPTNCKLCGEEALMAVRQSNYPLPRDPLHIVPLKGHRGLPQLALLRRQARDRRANKKQDKYTNWATVNSKHTH